MSGFLNRLAEQTAIKWQGDYQELCFVFPNKRSGLFFKRELSSFHARPAWSPQVVSMEDFVVAHTELKIAESSDLMPILYNNYRSLHPEAETFDRFFYWGELIIKDFEEIDQYLANPTHVFSYIKSQKELDQAFYFLSEEEKQAVYQFWGTFLPEAGFQQRRFLETWQILQPLYELFTAELKIRKLAYKGLIYRMAATMSMFVKPYRHITFVGFNALTPAEQKIIENYIIQGQSSIVWDCDKYYLEDEKQEAGYFLRQYKKSDRLGAFFDYPNESLVPAPKAIKLTQVAQQIGQIQALVQDLEEEMKSSDFIPERTAILLPDESLLMPLLHALPVAADNLNITMGYPAKLTLIHSWIEKCLLLAKSTKVKKEGWKAWQISRLIKVVEHPIFQSHLNEWDLKFLESAKRKNQIFVNEEEIPKMGSVIRAILPFQASAFQYINNLLDWLSLQGSLKRLDYITVSYLKEKLNDWKSNLDSYVGEDYSFALKLYKKIVAGIKVPFSGEPLKGLQIMGVMESRNLDFDRVFILNMNEDSFPVSAASSSFIPYNIRKAFSLPTQQHQEAIYAYLFYRLLHQTKRMFLYANTVSEFNQNGEVSRFIRQIEQESDLDIHTTLLVNPLTFEQVKPIIIEKSEEVIAKMTKYTKDFTGLYQSRLTPSALETYLTCRLKFYLRYVEELFEPEEYKETLDPVLFGTLLHEALTILYSDWIKQRRTSLIQPQDFVWIKEGSKGAIQKAFKKFFAVSTKDSIDLDGRNKIIHDILWQMIDTILEEDKKYAPFEIKDLETAGSRSYPLDLTLHLNDKKVTVGLKGNIDRIDQKDGVVRIVDYKTGRDERTFNGIEGLTDRKNQQRNKAAFQVLFYSYLVSLEYDARLVIQPALYNSKDIFRTGFDWRLIDTKKQQTIDSIQPLGEDFKKLLQDLLEEMWNIDVPFDQTEDLKKCKYCSFASICQRDFSTIN